MSPIKTAERGVLSLEALLISRSYLYTLFHKLAGGEPTDELLDMLLSKTTKDVIEEYAGDDLVMNSFNDFLETLKARDRKSLLDEMRDEYTRCFIGPASLPASPFASPYITHDQAAFQKRTLEVRACYRAHGLQLKRLQHVPDDHLSLLCAFAATLADRSLALFDQGSTKALADSLRDQKSVVEEHLASWLADYAKTLRRSKTAVFYPQAFEALVAFVNVDVIFLGEAAYWATEREQLPESDLAKSDVFSSTRNDREKLQAIRLFSLEENELVELD